MPTRGGGPPGKNPPPPHRGGGSEGKKEELPPPPHPHHIVPPHLDIYQTQTLSCSLIIFPTSDSFQTWSRPQSNYPFGLPKVIVLSDTSGGSYLSPQSKNCNFS